MHEISFSVINCVDHFEKDWMGKLVKIAKPSNENCACYVLITCSEPNAEGNMEVEMNYQGDETLAAYLVENAVQIFDDRFHARKSK